MKDKRHAIHPIHFKQLDTQHIRDSFLIETLFLDDTITSCYTHYDRLIIGGAKPVTKSVLLNNFNSLKSEFFLERREIGIINIGGTGSVTIDGLEFSLENKEALYIGRGAKDVVFHPGKNTNPLFYFNSALAHTHYPTRKVSLIDAETVEIGSQETSNHRTIRKLLVNSILKTCQLQMGLTELKKGSIWNTMPPHTHDRRMEAYFYFDIPIKQMVCHFMGEPNETRHIWVQNNQAVISPPWSIHSGAGTSNYSFIWGMAGENLDYADMDPVGITELK